MNHTVKIIVCVGATLALLPAVVSADDKEIIEYREHIMKTLNEQSAALGMILSTSVPSDNAAAHLQAIALTASTALKAYEPKVLGGEAKAEVWTNWDDFSKRMNEFSQKAAAAAKIAKDKGYDGELSTTILDALTCKSCHDIYRNEKK